MGKRFDLTSLAAEKPFVPPAFQENGSPIAVAEPDPEPLLESEYRKLPVASIALNPLNERPEGDDDEIEGLADTLRDYGVIQPLLVCSTAAFAKRYPGESTRVGKAEWVVLIGNRRLRAARKADVATVPAIVNDDTLATMYRAMLIENLQHHAMPPMYEAEAMAKAMKEEKLSQRDLAAQIGKTQGFISQRLALLKLVPELRDAVNRGDLHVELARTLGELSASEQRAIAVAGKPYRRQARAGDSTQVGRGWAASPARAASAIGKKFTEPGKLAELIALLNEQLEVLRGDAELTQEP